MENAFDLLSFHVLVLGQIFSISRKGNAFRGQKQWVTVACFLFTKQNHRDLYIYGKSGLRTVVVLLRCLRWVRVKYGDQFSSVPQSCLTLCNSMDCSTPGFPVHHQLLEFTQTLVHWVSDAIQPSNPLYSPFSSHLQSFSGSGSFEMSQFFASGGQSIGVSASTSVLSMNIQDWFPLGRTGWVSLLPAVQGILKTLLQHHSSKAWWYGRSNGETFGNTGGCPAFSVIQHYDWRVIMYFGYRISLIFSRWRNTPALPFSNQTSFPGSQGLKRLLGGSIYRADGPGHRFPWLCQCLPEATAWWVLQRRGWATPSLFPWGHLWYFFSQIKNFKVLLP